MLSERHAEHAGYMPARVLNLVCVVDRAWSGEIANRLRNVGDSHASRTIVCAVEPGRTHARRDRHDRLGPRARTRASSR